jgi:hypothetical protein
MNGSLLINSSDQAGSGLQVQNTTITLGDEIDDAVLIQGGTSSIENCTVNVAGYLDHETGRLTVSNSSILNISTAGVRDDANYNYYIGPNASFKFANTPNATVVIKNGNLNAPEVYIEQNETGYAEEFEIHFDVDAANADQDNSYELVSNYGFKKIRCNVKGTSNNLYLKPIATNNFTNLSYNEIEVASGILTIDRLLRATVNTNFNSTSDNDLVDNGYMYVIGTLTMTSNLV